MNINDNLHKNDAFISKMHGIKCKVLDYLTQLDHPWYVERLFIEIDKPGSKNNVVCVIKMQMILTNIITGFWSCYKKKKQTNK